MEQENTVESPDTRIYLIGMMGAGKSVVGRQLATALNYTFVDTDELVEEKGMSIVEIFRTQGEETFRKREIEALMTCTKLEKTVIATGGGLPCHYDNLEIMLENGAVVYLKGSPTILAERLDSNDTQRPLLSEAPDLRIQQNTVRMEHRRRGDANHLFELARCGCMRGAVLRRLSEGHDGHQG